MNILWFQFGWWALVLTAAKGFAWVGLIVSFFLLVIHFKFVSKNWKLDVFTVTSCALFGLSGDYMLIKYQIYELPDSSIPFPLWLLGLWILFPITLNYSMEWSLKKPSLFPVLGFTAAFSYGAGEYFNILYLKEPFWQSVGIGTIAWTAYFFLFQRSISRVKTQIAKAQ